MLSFYTFATRKPVLPHSLPDFIGRLLVIRAGKPNVCFADACFSFAHMLFTRKLVLSHYLPDFIGRLLVIRAGKPNVCFADACFSFAHMLFTRKPALPRSLPDFIGRLLVIRAGNQMSASQTLAFPLHEYIVPQRAAYHYPKIAFYRLSCAFMLSAESVSLSVISICSMLSVIMLIL